jgi:hypothetical protein
MIAAPSTTSAAIKGWKSLKSPYTSCDTQASWYVSRIENCALSVGLPSSRPTLVVRV